MKKERSLSPKRENFCREYVVDMNATQAAIRAGYSPKTAQEQSSRLLSNVMVREAIKEKLKNLAKATETEAEWVRRRLKEEADNFGMGASHSARIRSLEVLAKINGMFEEDNKQKTDPLRDLLQSLGGNVMGVSGDEE